MSVDHVPFQLNASSIPLVVHDPYFSYWVNTIARHNVTHWTGHMARWSIGAVIDGTARKIMGNDFPAPPMTETGHSVWPTRTIFSFEDNGIRITLEYLTPALPHRPEVMARPLTYVNFTVESIDGAEHQIQLINSLSAAACVDRCYDMVCWGREEHPDYDLIYFTAAEPHMLINCGDDQRIDWGRFYIGVPKGSNCIFRVSDIINDPRDAFMTGSFADGPDRTDMPKSVFFPGSGVGAAVVPTLTCSQDSSASFQYILAYDDIESLEYLGKRLCGYWKKFDGDFPTMLSHAAAEYPALADECRSYDREFFADAAKVGGEKYASLCALTFRQAVGAHKLAADSDGTLLFFSKENFSNGCIATVDVTYPSAPLFLLTNPDLLRGMIIPILEYASSDVWPFDFAPHDLGTYPLANGQSYGGGSKSEFNQMPVEECGNMLLLAAMLDKYTGGEPLVDRYIDSELKKWADYLLAAGYDPENQLCTDDFAGKLARNVNLSAKAIIAVGAYARMLTARGREQDAVIYRETAEKWAADWVRESADDGHSRLTFDLPGSWSQKYNLIWDRLLGLGLFPAEVAETEAAWYRSKLNRYGLPLDSRRSYTKLDWTVWSAALTGKREDFDAIMAPLYDWIDDSPDAVPLADWCETTEARKVRFQARSVVGGMHIMMLADESIRNKYQQKLR